MRKLTGLDGNSRVRDDRALNVTPSELKKALHAQGFEVYRTLPAGVALAERVRENLILDSGIRVQVVPTWAVMVVFRAEKRLFPQTSEEELFNLVAGLCTSADGFVEEERKLTPIVDPSDGSRILDTFCEIVMRIEVASLEEATRQAKLALQWERSLPGAA